MHDAQSLKSISLALPAKLARTGVSQNPNSIIRLPAKALPGGTP